MPSNSYILSAICDETETCLMEETRSGETHCSNGIIEFCRELLDWFSRYVISWRLSNTLDQYFCLEMLEEALSSGKPAIFNSDQGSQFTALKFTGMLEDWEITVSMDGRGRYYDNIFIERLWRTVKYEEVYLHDYRTVSDASTGLEKYFRFYNHDRYPND